MRFAHRVPLVNQPTFVEFRQFERQPLIAFVRDNWTMMRLAQSESLGFNSGVLLDLDVLGPLGRASMATRISIGKRVFRIVELLDINIGNTRIVNRVRPTQIFVMADYGERHS